MITRIELRDKSFNLLEIMDKEFMNLSFGYSRIGGCDSFSFDLPREFCNERFISGDFNVRIYDRRIRTIDDVVVDDVTLDMMEYSSDANAQAAYVSNALMEATEYSVGSNTLLIHFNGVDGATTYTAETGQTVTFVGTAQLDTAQKKFGTASLLLDGNSDYVTVPDSADWDLWNADTTVDCWIRMSSVASGLYTIVNQTEVSGGTYNCWLVTVRRDLNALQLRALYGNVVKFDYTCPFVPVVDTWYHIAVVRSGTTCKMFIDGDSKTVTENTAFASMTALAGTLNAGVFISFDDSKKNYFNGYIDELRISKGIAIWTSDFSDRLQSYSESTIKEEGSYSLKGVATTGALNKTLTRTIGSPIDLTDINTVKFKIRSSRTGSNIKIGLHDSGGTTTESTPNITDANTWQAVSLDMSGVANANKDAIDSIIITIVNADSANTFYIDELFGEGYTIEGYTEPYYNLIYQGLVEDKNPSVKGQEETIQVSGHGYQVQLDRMYIANKTYTSTEVSEIVKDILDTYVVPYTDITYDDADIEVTTFTPSSIKFNTTAKNALQTLADIVGLREWGVDKDRKFFFKQRSSTVGMRFAFGNKGTGFTSDDSFKDIINRVIIQGGDVSGTPYTNTYNNLISQTKYGRRDQVISNSSVTEDDVAEQLADAVLNEKSDVVRRAKLELVDYNTLIEETIPIPLVAMISRGVAYGERRYGTFLYAGEISYQVNKITYKINDVGILTTNIDMGAARPNLSETIGQLEYELEQLRSGGL